MPDGDNGGIAVAFTFVDNSTIILRKLSFAMDNVAEEVKETLIESVQDKILYGYNEPHGEDGHTEIVDTGRLFDSIDAQVKRVSQNAIDIKVGSTGETNYAVYVHEGTYKLNGRPFITDGVEAQTDNIKAIMTAGLRNG